MDVAQLISHMREAVLAEKHAVQKALGALGTAGKVRFSGGLRLHAEPGAHVYRLGLEVEDAILEGTRVQLQIPGHTGSGETLRHDLHGDGIECVFREDLGDELPPGTLEFDASFLLDLLEERLLSIAGGPGAPATALEVGEPFYRERGLAFLSGEAVARQPDTVPFAALSASQEAAVQFVMGQEIAYLWGPPGTGKTQTVAQLVHALLGRDEKVLLTAHTNIATDNVLLRVLRARELPRDAVIRVGYHGAELEPYEVGLGSAVDRALERSHPEVLDEIRALCRIVADLHPRFARSLGRSASASRQLDIAVGIVDAHGSGAEIELAVRLADIGKRVEELQRQILAHADLVATTLTRCTSSRLFREFRTDAVLVDEASTASLATSFVAGCMARRRAIAIGDFKQLPTIVQASHPAARQWLGRHVFESSGANQVQRDHPLRAMLHEQWRMHPQIAGVVSRIFYGGRLTDAPAVLERADAGPAVALLDTTRLSPRSSQTPTGSKVNEVHAGLVAELVVGARRAGRSVAVICPYRGQVRRIREAVRARQPQLLATSDVEIFTVHRFQGRDKDVVIFDLTEAPGTRCSFLDEVRTEHAPNLVNVAMSRARERLLVVGAFEHLRASLGTRSIVMRVLVAARTSGALQAEAGHAGDADALERFFGGGIID